VYIDDQQEDQNRIFLGYQMSEAIILWIPPPNSPNSLILISINRSFQPETDGGLLFVKKCFSISHFSDFRKIFPYERGLYARIEPGLRKVIDPGKDWTSVEYHAVFQT
jgi:hypothetical protein